MDLWLFDFIASFIKVGIKMGLLVVELVPDSIAFILYISDLYFLMNPGFALVLVVFV